MNPRKARSHPKPVVDFGTEHGRRKYWGCQRKIRHESERIALREAAIAPVPMLTYRCLECKGWHLTKDRRKASDPRPEAFEVIPE